MTCKTERATADTAGTLVANTKNSLDWHAVFNLNGLRGSGTSDTPLLPAHDENPAY